jgi:hypothetical protein
MGREASALANAIPEESGEFRFLRAACLATIKGSMLLLICQKLRPCGLPHGPVYFYRVSLRPTPLLAPSLVFSRRRSVEAGMIVAPALPISNPTLPS